ncbi:response regulator transcription factor [Nocardia sp. CA-119907]|uniref:response regulator transcription factor n=1 Tax=Nocardia sp. CA-119907 TaxID=3239973 RepID=UPI003D976EC7
MNTHTDAARILVVDDDPMVAELLSKGLEAAGFTVATADTGNSGLDKLPSFRPDALILDVVLPGMSGFGMLRRMRAYGAEVPVLFLSARDDVTERLTGLSLGADDFIGKPFSLEEVIERVRAILRRTGVAPKPRSPRTRVGDIELDDDSREVWKAGEPVVLSRTEFALLRYFMLNVGRVLSKPTILDHVWQYDAGGDVGVVESYVSYLRAKVDTTEPRMIQTLRGVGYVMREPTAMPTTDAVELLR